MAVILLAIAGALLVTIAVLFALQSFRALQEVVSQMTRQVALTDRIHSRDHQALQTVLDRLMAMDFQQFKDYQLTQAAMEGSTENIPHEERLKERPYLYPPPEKSAFKEDHEARYGPSEDVSSEDQTQILHRLEDEGLPK